MGKSNSLKCRHVLWAFQRDLKHPSTPIISQTGRFRINPISKPDSGTRVHPLAWSKLNWIPGLRAGWCSLMPTPATNHTNHRLPTDHGTCAHTHTHTHTHKQIYILYNLTFLSYIYICIYIDDLIAIQVFHGGSHKHICSFHVWCHI